MSVTATPTSSMDSDETKQLIEFMRQKRVLISNAGRFRNILKIRPPLVFQRQHADILLEALDQSLGML